MKKSFKLFALTGILALALPVFLSVTKNAKQVSAYSASSLPTTIDLNDSSASTIRSYYSSLSNLSTSERQGTNLLKNLKTILKNGQKYYSYENGTSIWQMYEITDRDWAKSPASSTTYGTYNSSTNKITNYTYGTSASSSKNNPYIHALYINRDVNNQTTAWDNHNQDEWGINREHVWPKAEGFDSAGAGGARGDPMHLMAGNGYSNNIHSNYYYGYVKTSSSYTDCGSKYSNQSGNLRGTSKTVNSGTVFEPQDCDKGDIARAIFYMVARYNYLSGSDSDKIDTNNPNLTLTQNISDWSSSGYTSSSSTQGKLGILTDLLAWHHADPVDEYEIHRNNLLYTNFTNNRNPFIDFPEWADFIWGTAVYNGSTYVSYDSNPTGYATPSSDTINGYNSGGTTVSVTGVSLNKSSTSITVGGAETLEATVAPSNATNKNVTWTSSNTSVATVSNGTVRGVAEGSSTITVTTSDGGYTATCTVTVSAAPTPSGEGSYTIAYNDTFSPTLPNSSSGAHTTDTAHTDSTSGFNFKEQSIYKGDSNSYLMFVQNKGFLYNTDDLGTIDKVSVTYSGGTSETGKVGVYFGNSVQSTYTTTGNATIKGKSQTDVFTNSTTGNGYFQLSTSNKNVQITEILVEYHSSSATKTLTSISLDTSDAQTTFNVAETFNHNDLVVTANYDDGSSDIVTPTDVSTPNMSTAGQKTVTVTYTENGVTKTATYTITVNAVTLQSIEVTDPKTSYYVGDEFVKPTVTATYSNGSTADVTESATFTGYNLSTAGNQTVTVSYTNVLTQTTSYNITVTAVTVTSIDVANPKTLFSVGDTFSFGGTVTAHYNNGSTADVTSSASFSGYNMSTAGNQTVTVSYGGQSTTYQITISESGGGGGTDTTKYALINSTSDLEAGKSYIFTNGTSDSVKTMAVTSNSNNRKSTTATITNGKITRGSSILSVKLGGSSGAWTFATENYAGDAGYFASAASGNYNYLRVISTAGTATISFEGNAAVINIGPHSTRTLLCYNSGIDSGNGGFACYQGAQDSVYLWKEVSDATLSSISLNTDNVQTVFSVGDTFNYSGLVVTAHYSDSSSAVVTPTSVSSPNMSTAGQKTVTVTYTEDGVSKTANYTITVSSSPSISWTSPSIDAYSGSTLSGTDVNGWAVTYNDGAGHQTVLTYNQLTVKLGGETISIPHTWLASDDGKTLTATYDDLTTTQSSPVVITQSINNIVASIESNYDYTFTSKTFYEESSKDLGGHTWTQSGTGDGYWGYDGTKGQQFGSGSAPYSSLSLTSTDFAGTIDSVTVYTSGASSIVGTIQVKVGGTAYGSAQTLTSSNTAYTFDLGGKSGNIVISWSQTSSKAIYLKEIVVNSTAPATNIANSESHKAAQRVAVKFANAFNNAMDTTAYCTKNLSSAWSTCSAAYNTFKSEAAALGASEEAYAKYLIMYATAQYSDDSGEACIERMLKTYEICVNEHGQSAFMSDLVSLNKIPHSPISIVNESSNNVAIIAIVTAFGIVIVGGYFFIHKKKYQ